MPFEDLFRRLFLRGKTDLNYSEDPLSPMCRFLEEKKASSHEDVWNQLVEEGRNRSILVRTICPQHSTLENTIAGKILKLIQQGNISSLSALIQDIDAESLDAIRFSGRNLLHFICFRKDFQTLKLLLHKGVNPNLFDIDGVCPLHVAVNEKWLEGVEELLISSASPDMLPKPPCYSLGYHIEMPILTAARLGEADICFLLMDKGINFGVEDREGNSILHLAALSRSVRLMQRLLIEDDFPFDALSLNRRKESPLHCLMSGEGLPDSEEMILQCVQLLIANCANVNFANVSGKTPLYLAARGGLESVVLALLQAGADPAVVAQNGRTALHAACRAGNPNILSLLLETGRTAAFVLFEDQKQMVPFHIAVTSSSIECCLILLQNGDHLSKVDSSGRSRVELVFKNMPCALHLLQRVFDSHISVSRKDLDDPEFSVKMNFAPLLSVAQEKVQGSIMSELTVDDAEQLLKHPLVESFLYLKWHSIKSLFYVHVMFYFMFLLLHSYFIAKTYIFNQAWEGEDKLLTAVYVSHLILFLILIIPGALYVFANIRKYLQQFETYFKFTALLSAATIMTLHQSDSISQQTKKNIAAISIFFAWVEFMMLLGRFPSLGIYILMFTRVAKAFIKFLMAFSSLIIAFAFTFGILFHGSPLFPTLGVSFMKTLMMMVGEIEYAVIYEHLEGSGWSIVVSHLFLVVFLFLVPILMTNLLISLAVNDLPDLHNHGKIRRLVKEASYLVSYERVALAFPKVMTRFYLIKCRIPKVITVYPNQCRSRRKGSTEIPPDALSAAVALTTNANPLYKIGQMEDNFQSVFKEFVKEYAKDRRRIESTMDRILQIAQNRVATGKLLRGVKSV